MEEKTPTVNTTETAVPPTTVVIPANDDAEARIAALEAEKAKLIEEGSNWKVAALKYKKEAKEEVLDLDEEERMTKIAAKVIADSRLAEIAREQDDIIRKALKENKELKLARSKPTDPPAAMGSHSETTAVKDTLVTNDQIAAFKARGWTDKDVERYKKNLNRYGGR